MTNHINVVDVFAGPGGLGEGFSRYQLGKVRPFKVQISVEREPSAHRTLTLRAFLRKFDQRRLPSAYYEYVRDSEVPLIALQQQYPEEWQAALQETLGGPRELGTKDDDVIFKRLKELKAAESGPFVVIGGPPCQAYSLMGRNKNGSLESYRAEDDNRQFLYKEYLKVLDAVKPEVFVMENVRGILTAKVNEQNIFPLILKDLTSPSKALGKRGGHKYFVYSLSNLPDDIGADHSPTYSSEQKYVIRCENHGIPQTRHRVILLGVRADVADGRTPATLPNLPPVHTNHVLDGLPRLRSELSRGNDSPGRWYSTVVRCSQELAVLLRESDPELAERLDRVQDQLTIPKRQAGHKRFLQTGANMLAKAPDFLSRFMEDVALGGCLNHFARSHMESDLRRYLFCAAFAEVRRDRVIPAPHKRDFPEELAPNHKSWETGKFADRFRVQFRGRAASTITSHINRDGHFFIHYDPLQCRSLTVREAARLQTFPDNYFFEGSQTQQYIQVGNAVPPFLASEIAKLVYEILA